MLKRIDLYKLQLYIVSFTARTYFHNVFYSPPLSSMTNDHTLICKFEVRIPNLLRFVRYRTTDLALTM